MTDPLVLAALRKALGTRGPIRLVRAGKRPQDGELFPSTAKKNQQAIAVCLNKERPLLEIVREQMVNGKLEQFVTLTDWGLEVLLGAVPAEEHANLMEEAAPLFRSRLAEKCLVVVRQHLGELEVRQKELSESRQRTTVAALQLARTYLDQLAANRQQLDREAEAATGLEASLHGEQTGSGAPSKPAQRPAAPPRSEEDLNFQRDISEELVYGWREAETQETSEALARVLFNVGVERLGEPGQQVSFDGRWQHSEDELNADDQVEIIRPGWRLVNSRGTYLITRAVVRKALRAQERKACQP